MFWVQENAAWRKERRRKGRKEGEGGGWRRKGRKENDERVVMR